MRLARLGVAASCAAFVAALAQNARAGTDDALDGAQKDLVAVSSELGSVQSVVAQVNADRQTPEKRLATGELLFRMKDYPRAEVILSEILEEFPGTPSYPDALWLRGETFYATGDYLAARRDYKGVVDHVADPRFQVYYARALARLVDVSLRLDDPPEALAPLLEKFNQVPAGQVDAGLIYSHGKALYRLGRWNEAGQEFGQVPVGSPYTHQAGYFQGLVAMKMAKTAAANGAPGSKTLTAGVNYKQAIETFRAVTELPPDTPEHRHVIDLSWMAIGRLFYEMEQYQQASEAYAKVGRESPEIDTMLYELAWVYVRLGDVERAERALEVLMVSDPNSEYISDGTLLRADLLLRAGAFDRALALYQGIRAQYDPVRAKVDAFLDSTKDVSVYYDKLAQQQLDVLQQNQEIPPIAVRWAREAEDGPLAFAVVDNVVECKALLRESSRLIERLSMLTNASTRIHAFPELEAGERTALGLINRLSRMRLSLARAMDTVEPGDLSGEIAPVRQRRRAMMGQIAALPVTSEEFGARDRQGQAQWTRLSQELTRRAMEVDSLQATVNGLRRVLTDAPLQGVSRDPASLARFRAELDANEADLRRYHDTMAEVRREVEIGRAQIGLGDARYQADAVTRDDFRDVFDREVSLAFADAAGQDAARFARQVQPLLQQARGFEAQLVASVQGIELQVAARSGDLQRKIEGERANVAAYQQQLDALDNDGRDLVGHVAQRNFGLVRDKLRGIVLRADVGITEQAWEVREEELDRVRSLQSERARQEQLLDEELKEVRDDGVEPSKPSP